LKKGYVQVYTGNGKGKTTAALGLALRACGHNLMVYIIQFMKGNIDYGEIKITERLRPNLTIFQSGRECFVSKENPDQIDKEYAKKGLKLSKEIINSGMYDIVILDEINCAVDFGLIEVNEVIDIIKNKPEEVEIILTGRNAPNEIIDIADLVTEMKEIKHYYLHGIKGRKGIEV
jgi:cob(I)alamin adenosyltransferase